MAQSRSRTLKAVTTPRAAALAGVVFAVLFAAVIVLLRSSLPEGASPGSQWLDTGNDKIGLASKLMPFAGISFLWFIGVVREGRGERLKETPDTFSGLVWDGQQALDLGLIDGLANLDAVARDVVNAPELVDYTQREDWSTRLAQQIGASMGQGVAAHLSGSGWTLR